MSTHTPEPWTLIYANDGRTYICGGEPLPHGGLGWLAQVNVDLDPDGPENCEGDANAVLMCAAPELLEACEKLVYWHGLTGEADTPIVASARAAIAKAKGGVTCALSS
jgi:hypothetical protein